MEHTTFFEHYRVSTGEDESVQEVSRTGAAINYKALDTRSHEPVQLQLIPVATIDPAKLQQLKERAETAEKLDHVNIAKTLAVGVEHDYLALVAEHFEGETADSWIVANGPMPADAALRVGLQVVRAIGAAAFFNLTHRAIQPSNLMIVPGESPVTAYSLTLSITQGSASTLSPLSPLVQTGGYKSFGATLNLPTRTLKLYSVPGDFVNALNP